MAPAVAPLQCRGMQSTRDEAPGGWASVDPSRAAPHAPDVLHGQHELGKAVSGPMATKERAAPKASSEATEPLERVQTHAISTEDEPATRGPGRPPQAPVSLEPAEPALAAACRAPARLAAPRAQVKAHIRGSGPEAHGVDLERGGRATGDSWPRISKSLSSRCARLPSTQGAAKAAWHGSSKPSGWRIGSW